MYRTTNFQGSNIFSRPSANIYSDANLDGTGFDIRN